MKISVVIPTLAAGEALAACLESLEHQSMNPRDFEVLVVNNGPRGAIDLPPGHCVRVLNSGANLGYGGGVNLGIREAGGDWILALNDDTVAATDFLDQLWTAAQQRDGIGMVAPRILRSGTRTIDSAGGLLIAPDGTSKQRGQAKPAADFDQPADVLLPSGCAALYRRAMLDQVGGFEESYFLYCEDTDLGLRARWQGWTCVYAPAAVVEHRYSYSSGGGISPLKAYYVERNRLRTVVRNFPFRALLLSPIHSAIRYWHHLQAKEGAAAEYKGGESLAMIALRAWKDALLELPQLLKQRRAILSRARLTSAQFAGLLRAHRITSKQVASL